VNRRFASRCA
jgi:hypothetical protein